MLFTISICAVVRVFRIFEKDDPIREVMVVRKQTHRKSNYDLRIRSSYHERRSWKRIASQHAGYVFQLKRFTNSECRVY